MGPKHCYRYNQLDILSENWSSTRGLWTPDPMTSTSEKSSLTKWSQVSLVWSPGSDGDRPNIIFIHFHSFSLFATCDNPAIMKRNQTWTLECNLMLGSHIWHVVNSLRLLSEHAAMSTHVRFIALNVTSSLDFPLHALDWPVAVHLFKPNRHGFKCLDDLDGPQSLVPPFCTKPSHISHVFPGDSWLSPVGMRVLWGGRSPPSAVGISPDVDIEVLVRPAQLDVVEGVVHWLTH